MTKKSTKSSTGKGRKRVAVKDLPKPKRELSGKEIKKVRGGFGDIKGESTDKDHKGDPLS